MLGLGLLAPLAVLESLDSAIILVSFREHEFDLAGVASSIRRAKPRPKGPAPGPRIDLIRPSSIVSYPVA